ncbi:MAG TPA: flagellar type III secretion system pore protein FliP [Limnochordia bacterium]|jgi:flagellar biosynthetic protein FliP|nr:flagellar type III secretion system pore protein FliP [Limnochordia bacterium]
MGFLQTQIPFPSVDIGLGVAEGPGDVAITLQILLLLTILTLAPAILVLLTSFTRTVIVLSLIRNALGTNQVPPNQVLIGLALFLTAFIMAPTFSTVYTEALLPYFHGELAFEEMWEVGLEPIRAFMLRNTREKDLEMLIALRGLERPQTPADVDTLTLIPAFVISELKTAFQLGFVIFVPFLVIDMVVASTLMGMGMMMLPPIMISLPFKLLLFVLVDGWHLIVRSLLASFT